MGKLILETQVSLDGFIADKDGGTSWMLWNWGHEWPWDTALKSYHTDLHKRANHIIISSQMAQEGFNAHWQDAASDPKDTRFEFASHIVKSQKLVVSTTLNKEVEIPGGWSNCKIIYKELEETIKKIKTDFPSDIIVYGGATLASSLISLNLIDEYHLILNPAAIGQGLRIFNDIVPLKLVNTIPFQCGIAVLHYEK
ncbi:dihydrofolate reductase family protein [Algoriphagus sp. AGSA1]|uniref:dihydrofolate reductase family protein n=1 Tax=Algoriphagus sp. AGSA1 TaxID=2907213 RepID=UPI001F2F74CD|nr:dihydrofolate reductase family protein [Algoriphagus sp. AGSA1]MCE7053885.1 dihydrofolate reductase family protein [Algoriphagus sp. AGSA1]